MRTLAALVFISLLGAVAFAQEATLNAPVTRTAEAKLVATSYCVTQAQVVIAVSVQDAGGNEIRSATFVIPDPAHSGATVAGFQTALGTVRATETGGALRKTNFRILGYLFDQGYLGGTSLNP